MVSRVVVSRAFASLLIGVLACGGSEPILDPAGESPPILPQPKPEWSAENCPDGFAGQHLGVTLSPVVGRVEVGDTLPLTTWVLASTSQNARCRVFFRLEGNLALVDSTKVVATGLGKVRITALLPEDSVTATLNVIPSSPIMPRRYRVVDITGAVANESVVFERMNQRREVVGNVSGRGVLWRPDGVQYLDGCARAFDVNTRGEVPCFTKPGVGIWRGGSITVIPELSALNDPLFHPTSLVINDSGIVAGAILNVCTGCELFVVRDGKFQSVANAVFPRFASFEVHRINNVGQIFVSDFLGAYSTVVYVVQDATLLETSYIGLGKLTDANDHGTIVGSVQSHPGSLFAFLALLNQSTQEHLGFGVATAVNNATQVVGNLQPMSSYGTDFENADLSLRGPFYWDRAAGVRRLRWAATDPSWVVTEALQIIDDGTILARADNATLGRVRHTVLLIPTP